MISPSLNNNNFLMQRIKPRMKNILKQCSYKIQNKKQWEMISLSKR